MDILVVSDTHGRRDRLSAVAARSPAGVLLFLGDGLRDLDVISDAVTVRAVRGNCDFCGRDVPEERVEDFGQYRIFMTHGHRYGVKGSRAAAIAAAARAEADVLLYGHTHIPNITYLAKGESVGSAVLKKPMIVFCPGSLGEPRDGVATFGTLTLRDNGILPGIGTF